MRQKTLPLRSPLCFYRTGESANSFTIGSFSQFRCRRICRQSWIHTATTKEIQACHLHRYVRKSSRDRQLAYGTGAATRNRPRCRRRGAHRWGGR